jgi:uncharacterized coiled-coil protein SlyX
MKPATKTILLTGTLLALLCAPAGAAGIPGRDGVIHACVIGKGKARGSVRLVRSAKACKRRRGERPVAWNAQGTAAPGGQGAAGAEGRAGLQGVQGERGLQGLQGIQGIQGVAGQVEQSLLDTIAAQGAAIESLEDRLASLETTVASACAQLKAVTTQIDKVSTAVAGLNLNGLLLGLGGALNIPVLPAALGPFTCA